MPGRSHDDWMHSAIQIHKAEDDDKFGCCSTCTGQGSDDCDICDDADLFELDEEALDEEDALQAA